MSLTAAQLEAIAARGNVLVVAGAGTGKTRTLVERCLGCLLAETPPVSLDEILIVTFTDAAAAEMRQRIRRRLEEERAKHPGETHWEEQLALFETAHLGTLHSFCLELVRQHFYELELDPQLSVLAEEEARLLAEETLDGLLQKHYAGRGSAAEAVQQLIQAQGRGSDLPIRTLVLRLHHYTQTLPDPAGWLCGQLALFAGAEPTPWQGWLLEGIADWHSRWLPVLEGLAAENELAAKCAIALRQVPLKPAGFEVSPLASFAAAIGAVAPTLAAIDGICRDCPYGKKTLWLEPLKEFHEETRFLLSLVVPDKSAANASLAPLTEDWLWVRAQMTTLLELSREFTERFTEAKRELGMVDFHDLEQHALRLLWDIPANQPTQIARQWRHKLRFVFVDEYQDINAAQDKIIEALSREGAQANRFLVGDVKQSIYRFRLANPHIFQGYIRKWGGDQARGASGERARHSVIALVDNFRSREGILDFINSVFGLLMRPELGGVPYDEQARLRFGAPAERPPLSVGAQSAPCVELHLRLKGNHDPADDEAGEVLTEVRDLGEADKEARLVGLRLRELKASHYPVWDEQAKQFRPADWRDMAILLRAPSRKAESFAKEFARLQVPLQVARGGFYQSLEILDLRSLLQVLDNPLQDLPLVAVLHSPLVGLTLDELANIRLAVHKAHFWKALVVWQEGQGLESKVQSPTSKVQSAASNLQSQEVLYGKVTAFLERFARWRRLARQASLSRCLEAVLSETHYDTWLLTQPRGPQRYANVQRLLGLAQEFDQFQRQGLFRFLRFIEAQQLAETEPEVAAVSEENAVRLLSIHQSKGLEFPIVVVADLAKSFNLLDLRAEIILDEQYGLCPQIKPPHTGKRYPSLPYWLAGQRQARELLGEELRLLYVAMTRARDLLVLTGSLSATKFEQAWQHPADPTPAALLAARSYADWLGWWFAQKAGGAADGARQGQIASLRWRLQDETALAAVAPAAVGETAGPADWDAPPEVWQALEERLAWQYRFIPATRQPAKTSVTLLRQRAAEADDAAASTVYSRQPDYQLSTFHHPPSGAAADIGTAHHAFLQLVSLTDTGSVAALQQEAERLRRAGALLAEEVALLDFEALAAFWGSELGLKLRAQAGLVQRELPFTARFAANELAEFTGESAEPALADEFVVVQGVADLAVLLPQEIWLVEFKTDRLKREDLAGKVRTYEPQLKLYARALSRIYRRPVTECWLHFLAIPAAVRVDAA